MSFFSVGIFLAGIFVFGGAAYGVGGESEYTLFYLFSSGDTHHVERAMQLEETAQQFPDRLQVVGIARLTEDRNHLSLDALRQEHGFSYDLVAVADASKLQHLPVIMQQKLEDSQGDYAVLVDAAGRALAAETDGEWVSMLNRLTLRDIATEIDESTWGKIKVLFE